MFKPDTSNCEFVVLAEYNAVWLQQTDGDVPDFVGNFKSILLALGVLFSKSAAFHMQKPRAVVPNVECKR